MVLRLEGALIEAISVSSRCPVLACQVLFRPLLVRFRNGKNFHESARLQLDVT